METDSLAPAGPVGIADIPAEDYWVQPFRVPDGIRTLAVVAARAAQTAPGIALALPACDQARVPLWGIAVDWHYDPAASAAAAVTLLRRVPLAGWVIRMPAVSADLTAATVALQQYWDHLAPAMPPIPVASWLPAANREHDDTMPIYTACAIAQDVWEDVPARARDLSLLAGRALCAIAQLDLPARARDLPLMPRPVLQGRSWDLPWPRRFRGRAVWVLPWHPPHPAVGAIARAAIDIAREARARYGATGGHAVARERIVRLARVHGLGWSAIDTILAQQASVEEFPDGTTQYPSV